jgi:hypothetical protein
MPLGSPTTLQVVNHGDGPESSSQDDGCCLAAVPLGLPPGLKELKEEGMILRFFDGDRLPPRGAEERCAVVTMLGLSALDLDAHFIG